MCRGWTLLIVVVLMGGCDGNATDPSTGSGPDSAPRLSGTYKVEQRCNGLGEARVDLSPRGRGGHYFLLVRGGDNPPVYTALDHLELDLAWNNDSEAFAEAGDGLPIYNWQTRLSKDPGWLDDSKGIAQMPEEGRLALHDLNVAMAEARADLHQQAGLRYMKQRRDYQGGSDTEGVRSGHRDVISTC